MDYLNCYRIEIDFLLNYFISLLQSSSYKNQDYANDEVCLFHLFLLSLPAIPCSHAMEREGIAKCFFFVFVFRYLILALSLSLSKFVFGCLLAFFGLVGLFVLSSLTSHTSITHKHILTHTHTNTDTDRQTYRTSRDFDADICNYPFHLPACSFIPSLICF